MQEEKRAAAIQHEILLILDQDRDRLLRMGAAIRVGGVINAPLRMVLIKMVFAFRK